MLKGSESEHARWVDVVAQRGTIAVAAVGVLYCAVYALLIDSALFVSVRSCVELMRACCDLGVPNRLARCVVP